MTSVLKVDNIQNSSGTDAISIDSGGKVTFPNTLLQLGMADQWRLTANHSTNSDITAWERPTDANGNDILFAQLGTGMSLSSGVFSFPSTGYYAVFAVGSVWANSGDGAAAMFCYVTEDNGTNWVASNYSVEDGGGSGYNRGGATALNLYNITDISNQKIKFTAASLASGSELIGDANINRTYITVFRIADAQ